MKLTPWTLIAGSLVALAAPVLASPCPTNVTHAVLHAHAGAVVDQCKPGTEDGKPQYEVEITSKDGKRMEIDVDAAGAILMTEEYVELTVVPPAVMTVFAGKFPGAKPSKAEKQTSADGTVTYELTFGAGAAKKEATFEADGTPLGDLENADDEKGQD